MAGQIHIFLRLNLSKPGQAYLCLDKAYNLSLWIGSTNWLFVLQQVIKEDCILDCLDFPGTFLGVTTPKESL